MRPCPVCNSPKRVLLLSPYDHPEWELFRCFCGMLYADSKKATEESVNEFYRKVYKTDDNAYSMNRLNSLADFLKKNCYSPFMDIGGKDRKLSSRIPGMEVSDAGDLLSKEYVTIVLSHTLEHVYWMPTMMGKIKANLVKGGSVVVELPIWYGDEDVKVHDFHFQHCNKFTSSKLQELFYRNGFNVLSSVEIDPYREYKCHRLVACYG